MKEILKILNKHISFTMGGGMDFNKEEAAKEIHDYKLSLERESVKKIILWTQDALHYGKITGSDNEIADRCISDLCAGESDNRDKIIKKQDELIKAWDNLSVMSGASKYLKMTEKISRLEQELSQLRSK